MHNTIPKIAALNGIVGFGKSSLAVTIPVVSAMGVQCCPVPTALFSNHPGFSHFFKQDLTTQLPDYLEHWKKLNLTFNGILSGFISSMEQMQMAKQIISEFTTKDSLVIIDPVMGDNGRLYSVYTKEMCEEMKQLVRLADILTPNLTEACILTDTEYHDGDWKEEELFSLMENLKQYPAKHIVISGISCGDYVANLIYDYHHGITLQKQKKAGSERSGTGDVFASVIAAGAVLGLPFTECVAKASSFVREAILYTEAHRIPSTDGVYFEPLLWKLNQPSTQKEEITL